MPACFPLDCRSHMTMTTTNVAYPWWQEAVIYQVYLPSFADSNGDGIGDLPGVTSRLAYLAELGVTALWVSPFFTSPQADNGYDISDYYDVDPRYGTLNDIDMLVTQAHAHGMRLIIDMVANHTSTEHPWFKEALASPAGSPARDRYIFLDGRGDGHTEAPNNWTSMFSESAWTRPAGDTQWYLHSFSDKQADLNWHNTEVKAEFRRIMQFWIARGVDGFRMDAAMCMMKRANFTDTAPTDTDDPLLHQPGILGLHREFRSFMNEYPEHCLIGEVLANDQRQVLDYVGPDKLHQVFAFNYQYAYWNRTALQNTITQSLQSTNVGSMPIWVTSSHDQVRHVSRLGLTVPGYLPGGLGPMSEQPSWSLGQARARAMICMTAFLPGALCLYYGEELGLPDHTQLEDRYRKDPRFQPSQYNGRDGSRIPMPWDSNAPAFGFSTQTDTWLPQPSCYHHYAVDRQQHWAGSMLTLYRQLLALRKQFQLARHPLQWLPTLRNDVLMACCGGLVLAINFGHTSVRLPTKGTIVARSHPHIALRNGMLPGNAAIWLRLEQQ
ncbi:glycosidases [Zymobacter palmae]|uniref:Glycosidases n=2 Tax=Zymobacter palmae TaxID=33074 RepID=A0A348HCE4_9GAMM|nr:glycosidases [Zymobacter palmae]